MTLIELLCVMAILTILASLLVPAVWRAYTRVKGMTEEWEAPEIAHLLRHEVRGYCAAHTNYSFASKKDFADQCRLAPKAGDWVRASRTEFVPFNYLDATNKLVLSVHIGCRYATLYTFTKGDLTIQPEPR